MALPRLTPMLKVIRMGKTRWLYGLDQTPDDRLSWTPGGEAASALGLSAKIVPFLGFVSHMLAHGVMPARPEDGPPPPPPALAGRDEAKAAVSAAFDTLIATMESLSEEDLARSVTPPWREATTIDTMVHFVPVVLGYFQGQLNYAQLAYGDTNPNIPPGWGTE